MSAKQLARLRKQQELSLQPSPQEHEGAGQTEAPAESHAYDTPLCVHLAPCVCAQAVAASLASLGLYLTRQRVAADEQASSEAEEDDEVSQPGNHRPPFNPFDLLTDDEVCTMCYPSVAFINASHCPYHDILPHTYAFCFCRTRQHNRRQTPTTAQPQRRQTVSSQLQNPASRRRGRPAASQPRRSGERKGRRSRMEAARRLCLGTSQPSRMGSQPRRTLTASSRS